MNLTQIVNSQPETYRFLYLQGLGVYAVTNMRINSSLLVMNAALGNMVYVWESMKIGSLKHMGALRAPPEPIT